MFVNGSSTVLKRIFLSENRLCERKEDRTGLKRVFSPQHQALHWSKKKKRILTESWKQVLCNIMIYSWEISLSAYERTHYRLTCNDSLPHHFSTMVLYNWRDSLGVRAISPGKPFSFSCRRREGTHKKKTTCIKQTPHGSDTVCFGRAHTPVRSKLFFP